MRKPTSLQVITALFVLVLVVTLVTVGLLLAGFRPAIEG
jgi:hypothetical protein